MAKHDWKQLQAQFLAENEQTGITAKDWCEQNELNYQSARRYIKVRKTAQSECAINSAQKKSAQTAQKHKTAQKAKSDKRSKKSAKDSPSLPVCDTSVAKLNGRDNKGRFAEGNPGNPNPPANFKPGNQAARKHGGYAKYFNDDELFGEARALELTDELELVRARTISCVNTLKKIREDMSQASTIEQRLELYNSYVSAEQAIDRNIARTESIYNTLSRLGIDAIQGERYKADTDRILAATDKIKTEIVRLGKSGNKSEVKFNLDW